MTADGATRRAAPTVLVTGATGFLGRSLVRGLLDDGVPTRVLVRSYAPAREMAERGADVVVGTITDADSVRRALEGVGTVYHLAGRLLEPGVRTHEYWGTHVEGTACLLRCCRDAGEIMRFVHCSTTGVLGVTGERAADEDAPLRPTNVYEATKAEAERAVRRAANDGFPAVIARPGLVYGPGDLHLLPFVDAVLRRRFRPIGRAPVWLHPIYIADLTLALRLCGETPGVLGECFHLAGAAPASLAALARAFARAGATDLPRGHIPLTLATATARLGDVLPRRVRRKAPLTSSRLAFLTHSRVYDVSKARRMLGFTASTGLQAGAARTVAWYRAHGHLTNLPAGRARETTCAFETT